jgi:hypothetical protein
MKRKLARLRLVHRNAQIRRARVDLPVGKNCRMVPACYDMTKRSRVVRATVLTPLAYGFARIDSLDRRSLPLPWFPPRAYSARSIECLNRI